MKLDLRELACVRGKGDPSICLAVENGLSISELLLNSLGKELQMTLIARGAGLSGCGSGLKTNGLMKCFGFILMGYRKKVKKV